MRRITSAARGPAAPSQALPTARPSRTSTATTIDSGPWAATSVANERRVPERGRAEDDAARAGRESRRSTSPIERTRRPTSTVARRPDGRDDLCDDAELRRLPCPRSVEIDDVEDRGAGVGEALRHLDRVVAVDRLPAEVALLQPNDATTAKVDRRDHVEGHLSRAPSIMLSF